jgi:glycosyltransferase involved in cell wall biosynthesis
MSGPPLSIIIPTRNRPTLLRRAIASMLAQTLEDLEIVIIEDSDPAAIGPA